MKILVAGANGFVGKNLVANLKNIQRGLDKNESLVVDEIYCYDKDTSKEDLERYCKDCDFVFNLVGVNRTPNPNEFMAGNFGFAQELLEALKRNSNKCPVMLSSSIQATLIGRYSESDYGESKLAGEQLYFDYQKETGVPVLVYRFANLYGKWCKPNYNSVVATFCHNIANDLPITINDPSVELVLVYIDDLIEEMIHALEGRPTRCDYQGLQTTICNDGKYCCVEKSDIVSLETIANTLYQFKKLNTSLDMPELPEESFVKKLYSTYLSYLPKNEAIIDLNSNVDDRGCFTEILHLTNGGQFSVNVSKPGITKGQHWHNSKWELFIVVKGNALIQQRNINSDEVIEFNVSGDKLQAVYMLPGYTHNIINLSDSEELITLMWANEKFNPNRADTFFEKV